MPIEITMPRLSDTMEEGTLVKWRVKAGDSVKSGDLLADVETDKATMELQSFDDGKVAKIMVEEGDAAPVGALILLLAQEGEDPEEVAKAAGDGKKAAPKKKAKEEGEEEPEEEEADEEEKPAPRHGRLSEHEEQEEGEQEEEKEEEPGEEEEEEPAKKKSGRIRISPLAAKLADEKGVDLEGIEGSGPGGRIIKRDVLKAAEGGKAAPSGKPAGGRPSAPAGAVKPITAGAPATPGEGKAVGLESKLVKLSNMRKTIARRLIESKTTIPHYQVSISVNMDPLLTLRGTLNQQLEAQGVKLSVNDFVVRACALAILQHPLANASWSDGGIQHHGTINIGVAVALPEEKGGGLVVPTVRDVQNKGLRTISAETKRLADKARKTGLSPEEMSDGTFTVSNLGMFGVEHFTAIINPPQSAILAVGAALEKAVVRDGQIVIGREMVCTLSADHRVLDGAAAAQCLVTVKQLLENPAALLV
ncbi:MAG: pyruvate dehydrogenase complex dihydrolipoamide acetyltransferase [Phycisphaeraceae bacterium]